MMRIEIDRDLCQAHGVCESEAPTVFAVEKRAETVTVLVERPDESLRPQVVAAAKYCPTRAIRIIEED